MDPNDLTKEIQQIRSLMERSSKFISISGLSSVLIGTYALIGAGIAYVLVYGFDSEFSYRDHYITDNGLLLKLFLVALLVLIVSLATGIIMAKRKAKKLKQPIWNATSKSLLYAVSIPLITGGILAMIFISKEYYILIASTLLVFYGLALCAGSVFTFPEIRWLGIFEIILGLLALQFPGYGLWFWVAGFGFLHIIYGIIVHNKYGS
ncbi:hypothetical protein [Sphingobacterium hungaricum]